MPLEDTGAPVLIPALLLLATAMAVTAARVDAALRRGDGENLFWIALTGLLTVLLAIVWAVAGSPGSGPWVGLAAVAGTAGAGGWLRMRHRRRIQARRQAARRARIAEIEHRHDAVLLSWSSYELDAWKALEKPGLGDTSKPETKTLMRAMKAAAVLRPAEELPEALDEQRIREYGAAVEGLEKAWERAEASAGGGRAA
ncbi:hypothetical protein ABIB35_002172 [Arthrobacter sp. UYP6]|uniref:hypothetical protein n=1 Tax=Arthrobacter sp. UYP6 TaxID=1756378 RepID=UPI0033917E54